MMKCFKQNANTGDATARERARPSRSCSDHGVMHSQSNNYDTGDVAINSFVSTPNNVEAGENPAPVLAEASTQQPRGSTLSTLDEYQGRAESRVSSVAPTFTKFSTNVFVNVFEYM